MKIENGYLKLLAFIQLSHSFWSTEQCGFWRGALINISIPSYNRGA